MLAVVVSMALVMSGILIGSRLPGRDATLGFPEGFALNYAGAPADSFAPFTAGVASTRSEAPAAGGAIPGAASVQGSNPDCRYQCDATSQSVEYVAIPGGIGVNYENSPASLGGQIFWTPTSVLSIMVEDDNGPGVSVFVCQRHTPDGRGDICNSGDVEIRFCSTTGARDVSAEGLRPGYVRIRVDTTSTTCPTAGTTGTITITW